MTNIVGNPADNVLFGTPAGDNIYGAVGNDILYGNEGNDFIDGGNGDDFSDGGVGNDSLSGGNGADVLYGNEGDDTLLGGDGNDALYGGNSNDILYGDNGSDRLEGQAGSDILIGGAGDDIYILSDRGDIVNEAPAGGTDTIQSSLSWRLVGQVENLTLLGTNPINGRGNAQRNLIQGNSAKNNLRGEGGNDRLIGGGGNDVLVGGQGADRFDFQARRDGVDRIVDFSLADTIGLSRTGFDRNLRAGRAIAANQLCIGTGARKDSDRIIYNPSQGILSFDSDGSGSARQIQLAVLPKGLNLRNQNIIAF